ATPWRPTGAPSTTAPFSTRRWRNSSPRLPASLLSLCDTIGDVSTMNAGLMAGKRGLVLGVANERSLAYGIARAARAQGAELAGTYQGEAFGRRAIPLLQELGAGMILSADVEDAKSLDAVFAEIAAKWGGLDFVVHSLAFSDREELKGRYVDTSRANFLRTLDISCYSFTDIARRAEPLMKSGGALLTLTFEGARRVFASYNVMGIAKA